LHVHCHDRWYCCIVCICNMNAIHFEFELVWLWVCPLWRYWGEILLSVSVIEKVYYRQAKINCNTYIFVEILFCLLRGVSVVYSCPLSWVSLYFQKYKSNLTNIFFVLNSLFWAENKTILHLLWIMSNCLINTYCSNTEGIIKLFHTYTHNSWC